MRSVPETVFDTGVALRFILRDDTALYAFRACDT